MVLNLIGVLQLHSPFSLITPTLSTKPGAVELKPQTMRNSAINSEKIAYVIVYEYVCVTVSVTLVL
jgi:hypothetical protein